MTHPLSHILIVDDEPQIVRVFERVLEPLYAVTTVTDAPTALEYLKAEPDRYDLLITDYAMPGLNGQELMQAARRIKADLPVLLVSGSVNIAPTGTHNADRRTRWLAKPVSPDVLRGEVADMLAD